MTQESPEDALIAAAGPLDLTLYSRHGCHLCDAMKKQIAPLVAKFKAHLREVNIDSDPILRQRYNEEVPVLFLGSRKVAKFAVDIELLRTQLQRAE